MRKIIIIGCLLCLIIWGWYHMDQVEKNRIQFGIRDCKTISSELYPHFAGDYPIHLVHTEEDIQIYDRNNDIPTIYKSCKIWLKNNNYINQWMEIKGDIQVYDKYGAIMDTVNISRKFDKGETVILKIPTQTKMGKVDASGLKIYVSIAENDLEEEKRVIESKYGHFNYSCDYDTNSEKYDACLSFLYLRNKIEEKKWTALMNKNKNLDTYNQNKKNFNANTKQPDSFPKPTKRENLTSQTESEKKVDIDDMVNELDRLLESETTAEINWLEQQNNK